jgi:hypothetical protein
MPETLILIAGFLIINTIAGSIAGRNRPALGALAGFFLGPVGVIAALALDARASCPRCSGRLDGRGRICQHCGAELEWSPERSDQLWPTPEKPRLRAEPPAGPVMLPAMVVTPRVEQRAARQPIPDEGDWDRLAAAMAGGSQTALPPESEERPTEADWDRMADQLAAETKRTGKPLR